MGNSRIGIHAPAVLEIHKPITVLNWYPIDGVNYIYEKCIALKDGIDRKETYIYRHDKLFNEKKHTMSNLCYSVSVGKEHLIYAYPKLRPSNRELRVKIYFIFTQYSAEQDIRLSHKIKLEIPYHIIKFMHINYAGYMI